MKKAIILFSGGLDSTTCLALAKSQGFQPFALSFNYGQKHIAELTAAKEIAEIYGAEHKIIDIPLGQFSGSALTDHDLDIPDYDASGAIPITYVPARNTLFLSYALAWAEVLGAHDIFIGASSIDYSGYPDCRPEYLAAFEKMANLATKIGVESGNIIIHRPLSQLSKAQTVNLGLGLGVDYSKTISCYRADISGSACGQCDSCVLRKQGFVAAEIDDPTKYMA